MCGACAQDEVPNHDRSACEPCLRGHVEAESGACTQCMDGQQPNEAGSACVACDAGTVGRDGSCMTCAAGTVPNSEGTACNECPEGESTTLPGTCNADQQCLDIECTGPFKRCVRGACVCEAGFVDDGTGMCARIDVEILEAAIKSDGIRVRLSPALVASGPLRIMVSADGMNPHNLYNGTKAGGEHDDFTFFGMDEIPMGGYSVAKAEWTVGGLTVSDTKALAPAFKALGNYGHTRYNTPDEDECEEGQGHTYIWDNHCTYEEGDLLRSKFIEQAALNGSGRSKSYNAVQLEAFCVNPARDPAPPAAAAWPDYPLYKPREPETWSFRRDATLFGACHDNKGALNDSTLAVNRKYTELRCGDSVLIVGVGTSGFLLKTITDYCPGCPTEETGAEKPRLDNYVTTTSACESNLVGDLHGDPRSTIKLLERR